MNMNDRILKLQNKSLVQNKDIRRTSVYIPQDLSGKVQESAKKHRRSFNQELLWLVEKGLECQKEE